MTGLTVKTPWHLWVVGVISLLWNAFGGYDFVMSSTQGEAYWRASGMDQTMIDYYHAMPAWMYAPWILGVWGAVLGSILLLARSRWAAPVFGLSLLGAIVSLIYQKFINPAPPPPPALAPMAFMSWVIVAIAALLFWYAWTQRKKGVLR